MLICPPSAFERSLQDFPASITFRERLLMSLQVIKGISQSSNQDLCQTSISSKTQNQGLSFKQSTSLGRRSFPATGCMPSHQPVMPSKKYHSSRLYLGMRWKTAANTSKESESMAAAPWYLGFILASPGKAQKGNLR